MLDSEGIAWEEGGHSMDRILAADEVVKSPGIPDSAPVMKAILGKGIPVISEIEFAGRYTDAKMVCITGSNGKTTTTLLTYHILRDAGLNVGLAGIEVYDLLRDEYDIQIEFGDLGNILAYISIGDRQRDIERLVSALAEIRRRFKRDKSGLLTQEYIEPQVLLTPQQAFYAPKESLPLAETLGRISSEFVMCYPPGIPIVAPGEQITPEILAYISYAKEKGSSLTGPEDAKIERLNVII